MNSLLLNSSLSDLQRSMIKTGERLGLDTSVYANASYPQWLMYTAKECLVDRISPEAVKAVLTTIKDPTEANIVLVDLITYRKIDLSRYVKGSYDHYIWPTDQNKDYYEMLPLYLDYKRNTSDESINKLAKALGIETRLLDENVLDDIYVGLIQGVDIRPYFHVNLTVTETGIIRRLLVEGLDIDWFIDHMQYMDRHFLSKLDATIDSSDYDEYVDNLVTTYEALLWDVPKQLMQYEIDTRKIHKLIDERRLNERVTP